MKITGGGETRGLGAAAQKRRRDAAGGGAFTEHLSGASAAAATETASGVGNVAALLAVQAAGDALQGRKQAYARADAMLKRLDAIRLALLDGRLDNAALKRLADDMSRHKADAGDPQLAELVAEIELRAAVELAKRGLG